MTSTGTLREAIALAATVPCTPEWFHRLPDDGVVDHARLGAELRRLGDLHTSLAVGEIARRSTGAYGSENLLHRTGYRRIEDFVKTTAGVTGREAGTLTRVAELTQAPAEGLGPVATAVLEGTVTAGAADAIRAGLGDRDSIPVEVFEQAAERLCVEAQTLDPDRLQKRAREIRDEIDEAGIPDREHRLRQARSFKMYRQSDGLTKVIWVMDPLTAASVTEIYDRATSPRRGGPRFVDNETAERIVNDSRSTEQLASDTFQQLLEAGATVDDSQLVNSGGPVVKLIVPLEALDTRTGHGVIEGSDEAVSLTTVEAAICTGTLTPYVLDPAGQVLNLGRTQRLFSTRQKAALALRDGGCLIRGCPRPASWCEAHHRKHWTRDHGPTDLDDGVLLCKHHHLMAHNEGWEIDRRDGVYVLRIPGRPPETLESKSRAVREHIHRHTRTG
jgi:hypothetical protein